MAIVDRNTGRPIEFKPAALVSFQPRFQPGEELLNGRKFVLFFLKIRKFIFHRRKSVTNYSQDFSMSFDEMRTERNNLTKSFGSAKNVKKLEANIRRSITSVKNFFKLIRKERISFFEISSFAALIENRKNSQELLRISKQIF